MAIIGISFGLATVAAAIMETDAYMRSTTRAFHQRTMNTPSPRDHKTCNIDREHEQCSNFQAVCSTGYAISYAGAVKIVEYFKEAQDNLDLELMAACRDRIDMACIGVWPQIITAASSHSNINHGDGAVAGGQDIDVAEVHAGPALQYSARINAEVVKKGLGQENWHPEWNTTWAMVHDEWTVVSFQEAKDLEQVATWESEIDGRSNGTRSW